MELAIKKAKESGVAWVTCTGEGVIECIIFKEGMNKDHIKVEVFICVRKKEWK